MAHTAPTLERKVLKVADATRMYGVNRAVIAEAIRSGALPATQRIPGTNSPYRIDARELAAWYERTFQTV